VSKAEEYRRMAERCQEIASKMSLITDREAVLGMARRWLAMAGEAEAEEAASKFDNERSD
jgi:hypothetical protein